MACIEIEMTKTFFLSFALKEEEREKRRTARRREGKIAILQQPIILFFISLV